MIVQDVIDNIRKNGLPKITRQYIKYAWDSKNGFYDFNVPVGACALGQAAINLNYGPEILDYRLRNVKNISIDNTTYSNLAQAIYYLNDSLDDLTFEQIADILERDLAPEIKTKRI